LKPKNQKQFNWSYIRFYLMWLLTTLLVLVPLSVLFSGLVKQDACKSQSGADAAIGVEKVNYEEVANGLDSLIKIVKDIDMNNDSRALKRTLSVLDNYRDDYTVKDNKNLSDKLRNLAGEIHGLSADYEESMEEKEKEIEKDLKSKEKEISSLETQITVLTGQLNSLLQNKP